MKDKLVAKDLLEAAQNVVEKLQKQIDRTEKLEKMDAEAAELQRRLKKEAAELHREMIEKVIAITKAINEGKPVLAEIESEKNQRRYVQITGVGTSNVCLSDLSVVYRDGEVLKRNEAGIIRDFHGTVYYRSHRLRRQRESE